MRRASSTSVIGVHVGVFMVLVLPIGGD